MQAKTVRDLGALVRSARAHRGMTQADLAHELRVSRDWVVRLEKGHPRLEAQKVLDALQVLGLTLHVEPAPRTAPRKTARSSTTKTTGARTTRAKSASTKSSSKTSATSTGSKDTGKSAGSTKASTDPFEALFGKKA
jgi:y4mF family transcriptional regulator